MTAPTPLRTRRRVRLHPLLVMLSMLVAAMLLTHVVPAGKYARVGGAVVAGSYEPVAKVSGFAALIAGGSPNRVETPARAAGPISVLAAIPAGMAKTASLMFMVMFVGGMFGVLQVTGAVDAGIDRLLHLTAGNVLTLTALLMLAFASGATFLGLYSEYIAIVPLVLTICQRLGLPNLYAAAVTILGAAIGYSASVTNPIVLAVAQPLAHVPVFSGIPARLLIFASMFSAGLVFMAFYIRRFPRVAAIADQGRLSGRQLVVLLCVAAGTVVLVVGTGLWSWGAADHAALFIAWAAALAIAGGLSAGKGADAFIDGMKMMVLPAVMIGLAGAIAIILEDSQVLDSVVHILAASVDGHSPGVVAGGILVGEMFLDVLVNSTSAKAAISLPILTPIAQMSGISGNVSVSALTMAGSLTNIITPTNGALLAFLAAAKVDYGEWARFVAPLFAVLFVIAMIAIQVMVAFQP
jgi:uncharacterized ion transporter superfamily protein YfcC